MAFDGTRGLRKMGSIPSNPVPSTVFVNIPANPFPGCCNDFVFKVFADNSGLPLQNDVNTIINWFDNIVTGATIILKKWNGSAWENKATISDNTYGLYSYFGNFINNEGQKFIFLQVSWAAVLAAFDTGSYKFTTTAIIPIFGNQDIDSHEFCLNTYSGSAVDGTIRLEYWLSGTTGDIEEDTKIKDFGSLSIYNSIRWTGWFGYPESEYTEDDTQNNNGQFLFVEDEQNPIFYCKIMLAPFFIHQILATDFMQATRMAITDYNSKNNAVYIQKFLRKKSGYKPDWYKLQSNLATVELQFTPETNRFRKFK